MRGYPRRVLPSPLWSNGAVLFSSLTRLKNDSRERIRTCNAFDRQSGGGGSQCVNALSRIVDEAAGLFDDFPHRRRGLVPPRTRGRGSRTRPVPCIFIAICTSRLTTNDNDRSKMDNHDNGRKVSTSLESREEIARNPAFVRDDFARARARARCTSI